MPSGAFYFAVGNRSAIKLENISQDCGITAGVFVTLIFQPLNDIL